VTPLDNPAQDRAGARPLPPEFSPEAPSPVLGFLEFVRKAIPADISLCVLLDGDGRAVDCASGLGLGLSGSGGRRDIVRRALEEGQPIFIGRPGIGPDGAGSLNAADPAPVSVLCLPLLIEGLPAGALYLERQNGSAPFSGRDLELLTALAPSVPHLMKACGFPPPGIRAVPPPALRFSGNGDPAGDRILSLIEKVKDTDAPVFIWGESGTGKELVARTIHETGLRRKGKFVAVNCGAIPDALLESEFFGHARGAFTGALRDKAGLMEDAQGGTFFLDEIGDLSLHLQSKLLRVLQEKEIRRIGENHSRRIDVRIISATNKNIEREIERGCFREDLYYRLRIIPIEIPPLRERGRDILPLLNHFVDKFSSEMNRPRPFFSPGALELLMAYPWPGNVRELQNEVQHSLVLAGRDHLIREEHLSARINPRGDSFSDSSRRFRVAKADFEKRFLSEALRRCGYHRSRTAAEAGLTRQGLFKLMKKHGIEIPARKPG